MFADSFLCPAKSWTGTYRHWVAINRISVAQTLGCIPVFDLIFSYLPYDVSQLGFKPNPHEVDDKIKSGQLRCWYKPVTSV
jgi:hypothetical protein